MPLLKLTTNQMPDGHIAEGMDTSAIVAKLSATVAEMLGKPESYVMVIIEHNPLMSFAGNQAPLAFVELKSLGLPDNHTGEFSHQLCTLLEELLGISPSRIYIEFSSPERHYWGWDKRTF